MRRCGLVVLAAVASARCCREEAVGWRGDGGSSSERSTEHFGENVRSMGMGFYL